LLKVGWRGDLVIHLETLKADSLFIPPATRTPNEFQFRVSDVGFCYLALT
jgi:hypothetical protein